MILDQRESRNRADGYEQYDMVFLHCIEVLREVLQ